MHDVVENTTQKDVIDMIEDLTDDIKGEKYSESQCIGTYTRGEWKLKHTPTLGLVLVFLIWQHEHRHGFVTEIFSKLVRNFIINFVQISSNNLHKLSALMWSLKMRHSRFSENENEVVKAHIPQHRNTEIRKPSHRDSKTKNLNFLRSSDSYVP